MSDQRTFGRRETPASPRLATLPAPQRTTPSLKDLGFVPKDDAAELRAFKQAYRRRRFVSRGGWRWIGGLVLGSSSAAGLFGFDMASWGLAAAGLIAIARSFKRSRLDATDDI